MPEASDQKRTILNLYNSGIEPEIISLELDINEDIIKDIIKNENKREVGNNNNSNNNLPNPANASNPPQLPALVSNAEVR